MEEKTKRKHIAEECNLQRRAMDGTFASWAERMERMWWSVEMPTEGQARLEVVIAFSVWRCRQGCCSLISLSVGPSSLAPHSGEPSLCALRGTVEPGFRLSGSLALWLLDGVISTSYTQETVQAQRHTCPINSWRALQRPTHVPGDFGIGFVFSFMRMSTMHRQVCSA